MTLRSSLARYVRGLLSEETSTPLSSDPPTSSPLSTPPTTTPTTTPISPATLEAGLLGVVLQTMREMQAANLREIRGIVTDILQGRPMDETQLALLKAQQAAAEQPSRTPFDPPDYDDPGTEDLPPGIQSIFEREHQEQHDVRLLRTEQEVLAQQLDEARAKLLDPQGPAFAPSSLTD